MRGKHVALITGWLLVGCPQGDPANSVGTATDSAGSSSTTDVSTSTATTEEPEPRPETAGSACGEPLAGLWGDCINGNAQACDNADASCLANSTTNPAWGTCILGCEDHCDCWAAPDGASAEPACAAVLPAGETACVLDCSDGQTCPDGMICVALTGVQSLCAFESEDFDPTGGPDPDSTTSGDASTSSSTGGDTDTDGSSSGSSSSSGTTTGR